MRRSVLSLSLAVYVLSACTRTIPVANSIRKTHHEAVWVNPSWTIKRSVWGAVWPFAVGAGMGAIYGSGAFGNKRFGDSKTGEIYSPGASAGLGAGMGAVIPGTIPLSAFRPKKIGSKRYDSSQKEEWVSAYPGNWVLLDEQNGSVHMVPRNMLTAYQNEEKVIAERAERARIEAAERAEQLAYDNVMNGVVGACDIYLSNYRTGKHSNEVTAVQPVCRAYDAAMNGTTNDAEAFLVNFPNARTNFRNAVLTRKGNLIEEQREIIRNAELARTRAARRLSESKNWVQGDNICMQTDGTITSSDSFLFWKFENEKKARYTFRAFVEGYNEDRSRFKIRIADMFRDGNVEIGKFEFSGTTIWRTNDTVWIDPREWDFSKCP